MFVVSKLVMPRDMAEDFYPSIIRRYSAGKCYAASPHCHFDDGNCGIFGWDSVDPWDSAPLGEGLGETWGKLGGPAGVKGWQLRPAPACRPPFGLSGPTRAIYFGLAPSP